MERQAKCRLIQHLAAGHAGQFDLLTSTTSSNAIPSVTPASGTNVTAAAATTTANSGSRTAPASSPVDNGPYPATAVARRGETTDDGHTPANYGSPAVV